MQETNPRTAVQAFQARRRATLARLRRVNAALAPWDEHDAAILLPREVRVQVEAPTLSRATRLLQADPTSTAARQGQRQTSWLGRLTLLLALTVVALGVMLVRGTP